MAVERGVTIISNYDLPSTLSTMEDHFMGTHEINRDSYRSWGTFSNFVFDRGTAEDKAVLELFETVEKINPDKDYIHFG